MAEDKSKMVDIDTSGDEVEIVLDEQQSKNEKETKDHGESKRRNKRSRNKRRER